MKFRITIACAFIIFSLFSLAPNVFAQTASNADIQTQNQGLDTCTCYCSSSNGSTSEGEKESDTLCRSACDSKESSRFLGCFQNPDLFPENNGLCWTQSDCEVTDTTYSGTTVIKGSDWGDQERICAPGMGYCYNKEEKITLGTAIQGVNTVSSFSEYISLLYAFLIPVASLIAVIMMMVGGLEWMLSAGNPTRIEKAKSRITNALIGVVLLLSAYSIAYLIDPNLVSFNELRLPKIRTVTYLDANSSCEAIIQKGGDVQPITTSQACGQNGRIISLASIAQNNRVVGLAEGDTCMYFSCEDPLAACVSTPTATTKYSCLRCKDAQDVIENVSPTDCKNLKRTPKDIALNRISSVGADLHYYCEFNSIGGNYCAEVVYPVFTVSSADALNCKTLREDAREQGSESCRAYDLVAAKFTTLGLTETRMLENYLSKTPESSIYGDIGIPTTLLHSKICSEDPCGLAPPGDNGCAVWGQFSSSFLDCVDKDFLEYVSSSNAYGSTYTGVATTARAQLNIFAKDAKSTGISYEEYMASFQLGPVIRDVNGEIADFNPLW